MAWYWWVLIIIGVIGIGYLKLKVWKSMTQKKKEKDEND